MNRRKKINQILKKKAKQRNNKLNPKDKPVYVAKSARGLCDAEVVDPKGQEMSES